MPNYKKKFGGEKTVKVDENDRPISTEQKWTYSLKVEDNYVKLYTDDIRFLMNLPKTSLNVLLLILEHTEYISKGGYVMMPPGEKKKWLDSLGWDRMGSLNNALSDLVKGKILLREAEGVYKLNPFLFAKGPWPEVVEEREKRINLYDDIHNRRYTDYTK